MGTKKEAAMSAIECLALVIQDSDGAPAGVQVPRKGLLVALLKSGAYSLIDIIQLFITGLETLLRLLEFGCDLVYTLLGGVNVLGYGFQIITRRNRSSFTIYL